MTTKILLVDDEKNVLDGFRRNLRRYKLTTALGPREGLEEIEKNGPFAVVVSDLQMPHMNGIEFLSKIEAVAPKTIRIMLTGQADVNVSIAAVNEGHVFRFLTKPCPPELLAATLNDALEQYRLIEAERELLEETLHGAVQVLTDVLALVDEGSQTFAAQVQATVTKMCNAVGLEGWQYELAAMLSQLGNLTLPGETTAKLNRGAPLTDHEKAMADQAPQVAFRLLERIPRLDVVAAIVRGQAEPPPFIPGDPTDIVAAGANLLHFAVRYHRLVASDRPDSEVRTVLENAADDEFRAALVAALFTTDEAAWEEAILPVRSLDVGMVLGQAVRANNGVLLLSEGQALNAALLERLRVFAGGVGVEEPLRVRYQTNRSVAA